MVGIHQLSIRRCDQTSGPTSLASGDARLGNSREDLAAAGAEVRRRRARDGPVRVGAAVVLHGEGPRSRPWRPGRRPPTSGAARQSAPRRRGGRPPRAPAWPMTCPRYRHFVDKRALLAAIVGRRLETMTTLSTARRLAHRDGLRAGRRVLPADHRRAEQLLRGGAGRPRALDGQHARRAIGAAALRWTSPSSWRPDHPSPVVDRGGSDAALSAHPSMPR
jgi:hypothetical protein